LRCAEEIARQAGDINRGNAHEVVQARKPGGLRLREDMRSSPLQLPTTRRTVLGLAALLLLPQEATAQAATALLNVAEGDVPVAGERLRTALLNGMAAGPLLQPRRGEAFTVRVENALGTALRFRLQGVRTFVPDAEALIAPGEARDITFTPPDEGSFAYYLDADDAAGSAMLSGPLVVAGPEVKAGREVLVAVNTLAVSGEGPNAPARRVVLVNGRANLDVSARPGEPLTLRLINLAARGLAPLKVPPGSQIIGIDGQPCPAFPPNGDLVLMPPLGRVDLLVSALGNTTEPLVIGDDLSGAPLVRIVPEGAAVTDRGSAPDAASNGLLPTNMPFTNAVRAEIAPGKTDTAPLLRARVGQTVILTARAHDALYGLRLEGQTARSLDALDDGWKPWWTDSVLLFPGETQRLAFVPPVAGRFEVALVPLESAAPVRRGIIQID
jgi:hypothetical protein